jgi:hypothetical protein
MGFEPQADRQPGKEPHEMAEVRLKTPQGRAMGNPSDSALPTVGLMRE